MAEQDQSIAEVQQKAAAFLTRKLPRFEPKSAERIAAEVKIEAEEQSRPEAETPANAQPGDTMPDGTIFAGLSPDTGEKMFAMSADAGVTMSFNEAANYAEKLNAEHILGHDDWRVPTKAELNVLFQNKDKGALKGTFNETGSSVGGWYWLSSESKDGDARGQRFSDGFQYIITLGCASSSVRFVRS